MPFLEDLVTRLEDDGVGAYGVDLFTSTKAAPPILPFGSATVQLVETGGTGHTRIHNAVIRPGLIHPGVQVTARAKDYTIAEIKARQAYDSFVTVRNQFINSGWYLEIRPTQEPFDGGLDARGQAQSQFNALTTIGRRPW